MIPTRTDIEDTQVVALGNSRPWTEFENTHASRSEAELARRSRAEYETDSRLRSGIPSAVGRSEARRRKLNNLAADPN